MKKQIRSEFRRKVFRRDGYRCVGCGKYGKCRQTGEFIGNRNVPRVDLDAHHITDRHFFENGGYVIENGVSLCGQCHELAEIYHQTNIAHPGFSPDELYEMIGSSYEKAYQEDSSMRNMH